MDLQRSVFVDNKGTKSIALGYGLALFLGIIGAHLFYYKNYIRAVLYLVFCWTYSPMVLGWIDMFFIRKWHNTYLQSITAIQTSPDKASRNTATAEHSTPEENQWMQKTAEARGFFADIKEDLTLYREEDVILPEYSLLTTPSSIM